ncbi:toprim domain-containing protein [Novosphingobium sp.]|uniref:toprim domain-containing protein n=1 Tax=Novosphingobium sp. TaxID=1874826 RepID=UPI0038BAE1EA
MVDRHSNIRVGPGMNHSSTDPVTAFLDAMGAAGIRPLEPIAQKLTVPGIVRFRADGDKPGRRNGWAVLHLDGLPAGVFGLHRLGIRQTWRASGDVHTLSPDEQRAIRRVARESAARHRAEIQARQHATTEMAQKLWQMSTPADPNHGYLTRKMLPPFGILQNGSELLVPMFDHRFALWNLQRIYPDGRKLFLRGGRTEGLFWPHGTHAFDGSPSAGPLVIGEGYATMAAIHDATGLGVVAAMSARNLESVAVVMRKLFPQRDLIIAADDDRHLSENIGMEVARRAACAVMGYLATPTSDDLTGDQASSGMDFADIARCDIAARIATAYRGSTSDA